MKLLAAALGPVAAAFETIGVDYYLAGSVASSMFGVARATADLDVVARLRRAHVPQLVERLRDTYYIDEDTAIDAIDRRSMFNVIHEPTMLKVDIYIVATEFDESALARHQRESLEPDADDAQEFAVATAEDVVVHKLRWYRDGGEVSDRQWSDILGVLRMQRALDHAHMRHWAERLGVADLLERAVSEATA